MGIVREVAHATIHRAIILKERKSTDFYTRSRSYSRWIGTMGALNPVLVGDRGVTVGALCTHSLCLQAGKHSPGWGSAGRTSTPMRLSMSLSRTKLSTVGSTCLLS
jgi:hypothetical protein